jgi:hypothetical protein
MNLDLLGSVALTLSASVVVAILAVGLGASARTRAAIVALFGLWFLSVLALAATETLHTPGLAGVAGLGLAIGAPMLTMIIAAITSDSVRRSLQRIPVSSLIVANTVRVIGVSFLVLHAQGRLTASFALTAGWGDIGIGLTAPIVAWFVATRGAQARVPLTIWNALGLLDLIVAISLGISSSPAMQAGFTAAGSGVMTMLPWLLVPGFLVPTLAASHLAIFYRLRVGLQYENAPLTRTTARPSPATL